MNLLLLSFMTDPHLYTPPVRTGDLIQNNPFCVPQGTFLFKNLLQIHEMESSRGLLGRRKGCRSNDQTKQTSCKISIFRDSSFPAKLIERSQRNESSINIHIFQKDKACQLRASGQGLYFITIHSQQSFRKLSLLGTLLGTTLSLLGNRTVHC